MVKKTILVVEDNKLNLQLVKCLLPDADYTVVEAANADLCYQAAREYNPDLILMDIQLPEIDGFTATKVLREEMAMKEIPIVILSSNSSPKDFEQAEAAGCNGYITKPIDIFSFLETVEGYMD